jgi:type IV secretory pathway VirB4 component
MNSVVRQMWEQNTDVVMVDTGNSYEGLCEYVGGKYISYTEEHPITMNPFRIKREELNVEKTGFLKNLIMLIWKGSQGTEVTKTEEVLLTKSLRNTTMSISMASMALPHHSVKICKGLLIDDRNNNINSREKTKSVSRIEAQIDEIEIETTASDRTVIQLLL